MKFSLARLRRGHLILATAVYWLGLAALTLARPLAIWWRLTHLPDNHGTIDAGFSNTLFHLTMTHDGTVVWHGQAYLAVILGWMFGPPALLFAAWWASRKAAAEADASAAAPAVHGPTADPALPPPSLSDRLSEADRDLARQRAASRSQR
jgi:hypothetical protein